MLQFHKTKSDEWVVSGPASEVHLGVNQVNKKDGSTEEVEVMRLGTEFVKDGVPWVYGYVYDKPQGSRPRSATANAYFGQLKRDELARKAGIVRYCDLCGEEADRIGRDGNGKLGDLCEECEQIEEEMRMFG